ncbi:transposase [Caballeronia sordidicola]|uniref:Transposase n=1 Tax=Caballeronia sordidicola TaxID=196367 RepID=A0A158HRT5_CABSO|nr:IS110 family transposase [Caballeronia sordidicola]SAL46390.1 transposase [Caballeronia sordidicola]
MTALEERNTMIGSIGEATLAGARQAPACKVLGLSARTVQRWQSAESDAVDGRSLRQYEPPHKLSADERAELLAVANSAEFGHLPPSQIIPRLADQQRYIASESTFYRVLKAEKQLAHRRSERPTHARSKPRAVCADAPNQLFSWDITYLPATIRGGVGPMIATAVIAAAVSATEFANGRQFAAWLGLTPRQHSSGGRQRLFEIAKRGNGYLRMLLVHGARSVFQQAAKRSDALSRWILDVQERRGTNIAVVALANKIARTIWLLLAREREYQPPV